MMDIDSPSRPRLDGRVAANQDVLSGRVASPGRASNFAMSRIGQHGNSQHDDLTPSLRSSAFFHATGSSSKRGVASSSARRESSTRDDAATSQAPNHPPSHLAQAASNTTLHEPSGHRRTIAAYSSSNSQETNASHDSDLIFTPPARDGGMGASSGNGHDSSQESQLFQLSQLAAAADRLSDGDAELGEFGATQTKRMADGVVKHTRMRSSASPVRNGGHGHGHSRNPSTISIASTTGSRIGELSAELKARLSYAMVKVNHGWQSHSIDQVESLASQATSPTSSHSTPTTVHFRNGASASPQLSGASLRSSNNSTPAAGLHHQLSHTSSRDMSQMHSRGSPSSPVKLTPSLAPPVSIEPSRSIAHPRRNSNARHPPTFPHPQGASPNIAPHTPSQASPYLGTPRSARTPMLDPILFSPHQNVREKDAIESLLFMSSPGNSANMKHHFPSSSQPLPPTRPSQRTPLPTSQPRKSLPNGRSSQHGHSHSLSQSPSQSQKRVGFEALHHDMDPDQPYGTPSGRTPRRKTNGQGHSEPLAPTRLKQLPTSVGLTAPARARPVLRDEDIERMLDRADDSSDSEGEIQIPVSRPRRAGTHIGA